MRRCLPLFLLAAVALAMPVSAQAALQSFFEYRVVFTGKGTYGLTESGGEGGGTITVKSSFKWNTVYPNVLIPTTKTSPLVGSGFPAFGPGQDAGGDWSITNVGSQGEDCTNQGTLGLPKGPVGTGGGAVTTHRPPTSIKGGGVLFTVNALTGFDTTSGAGDGVLPCNPQDFWHDWVISFSKVGDATGSSIQPLTTTVQLSRSDLAAAHATKHVSVGAREQIPSSCGSGNGASCTQSYTWSGTLSFYKHKL